jgi:hypothetical protein
VTLPGSVTSIGDEAFGFCPHLRAITVDAANPAYTSVAGVLFDKSLTTLVECPSGVAGSYSIPGGVANIGIGAFGGCGRLTGVTIPDTVTGIGYGAFDTCSNLTSITIPASVSSLGSYAFNFAALLKHAYFLGNAPPDDGTEFWADRNATIYYLPGTLGWGATYGFIPTVPWYLPNPIVLTQGPGFGVQNSQFSFTISWATNAVVVVEASTNLSPPVWLPVATNLLSAGSAYFSDPKGTNSLTRFYRLRSP